MKKILTLLFCIVAVCAIGQTGIPNSRYAYKTLADALSTIKANGFKVTVSDPFAGGNFILTDTTDGYKADGGMNIAYAGTSKLLSRISNERYRVYLSWFGGRQDSAFNSTFAYEAACAYLKKIGGGAVVIDGTYWMDSVKLYNRISIVGTAFGSSTLIARKITMNTNKPTGFVICDKGAVTNADMINLSIYANNRVGGSDTARNKGQWGAYIQSQFDDANIQGGYRNSTWTNVNIFGFDSTVWFRAGYSSHHSSLPIQHITINKPDFECRGGVALRATGQQGQMTVNGGKAKGIKLTPGSKAYRAVELNFDPRPYEVAKDGVRGESVNDVAGVGKALRVPGNWTFQDGFNAANSTNAFYIGGGAIQHLKNGWIENSNIAIRLAGSPRVYIQGWRFSNGGVISADSTQGGDEVSDDDDTSSIATGTLFLWGAKDAYVEWDGSNNIAGAANQFLVFENGITVAKMGRLAFTGPLSRSSTDSGYFPGTSPFMRVVDSTLKLGVEDKAFILVTNGGSNLKGQIDSIVGFTAPDNFIMLRTLRNITLTSNGNIGTANQKDLTYLGGSTILLQRIIGNPIQYMVVSAPYNRVSDIPVDSQFYSTGTILYNNLGNIGQPVGWRCVTGGYAVNDSVALAAGTSPRAVFLPFGIGSVNTLTNPVLEIRMFAAGQQITPTTSGGTGRIDFGIPAASTTINGSMTTTAQTFKGRKAFTDWVSISSFQQASTTDSLVTHNVGDTTLRLVSIEAGPGVNVARSTGKITISASATSPPTPYFITVGSQTVTASTRTYAAPGTGSTNTDSTQRLAVAPVAGTIKNLVVYTSGTQPSTGDLTFNFKTGNLFTTATSSSVLVTVPASASGSSSKYTDLVNSVHVSALDMFFIVIVNAATTTSCTIRAISFTFTPD